MKRIYMQFRSALLLVVSLLVMAGTAQAASCPIEEIELHLPDNEDSKTWPVTFPERFLSEEFGVYPFEPGPFIFTAECIRTSGKGLLELEIKLEQRSEHPELVELLVNNVRGNPYREVAPRGSYEIRLALDTELFLRLVNTPNESESVRLGPSELKITLKRLEDACAMSAVVTGDVNGYYFGDVAWFNAQKEGVIMDPEMAKALGNLGALSNWAADAARSMGHEVPTTSGPSAPDAKSFEDFMAGEIESARKKGPTISGSQFVLGLQDMQREQGDLAALGAFSGFNLGLGATPTEGFANPERGMINARVDAVRATLGIFAEDQVIFELAPGDNPSISVMILHDNFISGDLDVNLSTKGVYTIPGVADKRQLKVNVKAKYAALRGQITCARPW